MDIDLCFGLELTNDAKGCPMPLLGPRRVVSMRESGETIMAVEARSVPCRLDDLMLDLIEGDRGMALP